MAVILVGHSIVKTFNSPDTENYDQYQLKLDKHASAKAVEWCDAMLFANYEVKVKKVDEGFDKGKGKARMPKVPPPTSTPRCTGVHREEPLLAAAHAPAVLGSVPGSDGGRH